MAININSLDKYNFFNLIGIIIAAVGFSYLLINFVFLAYGLLVLPFVALVAIYLFKKPIRSLLIYIIFLPFHSLIITILIYQFGIPIRVGRLIAAWKEILLISTFMVVLLSLLVEKKEFRLKWIDGITLILLYQVFLYFVFHDVLFNWQTNLTIKAYGARDWLLYLIPYFIGRFIIVSEKDLAKIFKAILIIGFVTSVIGIIEYFFVPTRAHIAIGVPYYFNKFLNLHYPDYLSGLPYNYWFGFKGPVVRRAVSTYLSGQGFALPFLIIIPASVINCHYKFTKYYKLILVVTVIGLLLTLTRMTITAVLAQSFILLRIFKRKDVMFRIIMIILFVLVTAILAIPLFRSYIYHSITLTDDSGIKRPEQWERGLLAMIENPLGFGLGSTGQVSQRFESGGLKLGSEAGYLKVSSSLGIFGLFLYLVWFRKIINHSYLGYSRHNGVNDDIISLLTFIVAIGFLINNLTAPPDQSPFVIYIFCWLAGLSVQLSIKRKQELSKTVWY